VPNPIEVIFSRYRSSRKAGLRPGWGLLQREEPVEMNQLRERLRKDRPMTTIRLRIPEDVVEELKQIAPLLGFSGYQPLIRAYIGQGLRQDLERLSSEREQRRLAALDRPSVTIGGELPCRDDLLER
jgi:hypothetical protein